MKKLKSISVSFVSVVENARMNCGEKSAGNVSLIKKTGDYNYVSGQSVRRALFDTMESLNDDPNTHFSTSDSNYDIVNNDDVKRVIAKDIAFDIRGTMLTTKEDNAGDDVSDDDSNEGTTKKTNKEVRTKKSGINYKRHSTLKTNLSIALNQSNVFEDLLLRFSNKDDKHNIVHNEISVEDKMLFNFIMDTQRLFCYDSYDELGKNVTLIRKIVPVIDNEEEFLKEKRRRIELFLNAIECFNGFANQSRNVVDATPKEMLIVFNHKFVDNKFLNFFKKSYEEKMLLLEYAKSKDIDFILYDEEFKKNNNSMSKNSIYDVFGEMYSFLKNYDLKI